MELQFPPSFQILAVIILLSSMFLLLKIPRCNKKPSLLPPGPPKLPIIGNMHQLVIGSTFLHQRLGEFSRKYGPVMHLQLGEVSTIIISSPDAAKQVLNSHDAIFANRPRLILPTAITCGCKDIVLAPFGEHWRRVRKISQEELFSPRRVRSFRLIREEAVSAFVESIGQHEGSVINLSQRIFSLSMAIATRAAFGKRSKDEEAIDSFIKEATRIGSGFCIADMFPSSKLLYSITGMRHKAEKLVQITDSILEKIIIDHKLGNVNKQEGGDEDFVDVLLEVQSTYNLSIDSIKAVVLDIFLAGTETSATTIEWAMSEMLKNSKVKQKAQEEVRRVYEGKGMVDETSLVKLTYLKLVIKETLRLHPPVPLLIPRESTESCQIFGYELPAKTRVMVNAWAIGRDPTAWKEPDKFDPNRFLDCSIDFKGHDFAYIPFGGGRRICPGMSFGLATIELALAMLLYHFDWTLLSGVRCEDLDMTEAFGISMRRKNDLHAIPTRHLSSS
ncbi:hypothetical protein Ancab_040151 [Ancistrocladus abbreviatus]